MKHLIFNVITLCAMYLLSFSNVSAQVKYMSNGKMTFGDTDPYSFYHYTLSGTGMYFKFHGGGYDNFFQIDVTPANPRLAGHGNQVVFYNTETSTFNSIQVHRVFNYSDARAKTNILSLNKGLDIVKRLRPVSYNFMRNESRTIGQKIKYNEYTKNNAEIGLLAQEVETILPNLVYTDSEGRKLVDYTGLIPVLIDAVKSLQQEVEMLKRQKEYAK